MALNLLSKVNIHNGQKVLINGASGGIGSYAVQFSAAYPSEQIYLIKTNNRGRMDVVYKYYDNSG